MAEYFELLDRLVETATVLVDRPRGSPHPRYPEVIYPLDYGHLTGTIAGDGGEVDVLFPAVDDQVEYLLSPRVALPVGDSVAAARPRLAL